MVSREADKSRVDMANRGRRAAPPLLSPDEALADFNTATEETLSDDEIESIVRFVVSEERKRSPQATAYESRGTNEKDKLFDKPGRKATSNNESQGTHDPSANGSCVPWKAEFNANPCR